MSDTSPAADAETPDESFGPARPDRISEDWMAVVLGGLLLLVCLAAVLLASSGESVSNPFKPYLAKPTKWDANPLDAFLISKNGPTWPGVLGVFVASALIFGLGSKAMGRSLSKFMPAYCFIFALATLAFVLTGQAFVKAHNLEYALWALALGLVISNTIGAPKFARPAMQTEFFIKTGLVLLGAEVLLSKLLALGLPGVCVAWVVTPIVLISTYWFGQRVLRIESRSLNMVIAADMSVCGVSAAIATAAACKAKKEELSLAVGISLSFTVIMMLVMPKIIAATGMSPVLGGAWMGGTIDATGAVVAAGELVGEAAGEVAVTIKMIQNILIGVVAFFVAVYWVSYVEPSAAHEKPGVGEIWRRFPKFVIGFVAASVLFSLIYSQMQGGPEIANAVIKGSTKTFRGWFFCLAFVSIGLQSNFFELARFLKGGKPLVLYLVGQSLNLSLTLFMAWLMFEKVFPHAADVLAK